MQYYLKKLVKVFITLGVLVAFFSGVKASEKVYDISAVDRQPSVTLRTTPVYPTQAKNRGISGEVMLEIQIGSDGTVSNIVVIDSKPEGVFDSAAIDSVSRWRFQPAMVEGNPVNTRVKIPVRFQL